MTALLLIAPVCFSYIYILHFLFPNLPSFVFNCPFNYLYKLALLTLFLVYVSYS